MKSSSYIQLKGQIEKVIWITFFWMLVSISQFARGYITLNQFNRLEDIDALAYFQGSLITGLMAGILGGSFIVFFWENWFRNRSYGWALLNVAWSFTLLFLAVSLVSGMYFSITHNHYEWWSKAAWQFLGSQFFTLDQLIVYLFWLTIVAFTMIALSVNDKYGPGVFVSFLLGKYFHPKREERVFMFLDLKGSTAIAEKLGEEKYFNFLKDVFKDATPSILNNRGQIYQYVGDEIVVSWESKTGSSRSNCLQCYFDIQTALLSHEKQYKEKYQNVVPFFKAGFHYGSVMVGEIGIVKRDIVYSGDVLNTAARIQAKCNDLKQDIIISKQLLDHLAPLEPHLEPFALGEIELRGKQNSTQLFTVFNHQ